LAALVELNRTEEINNVDMVLRFNLIMFHYLSQVNPPHMEVVFQHERELSRARGERRPTNRGIRSYYARIIGRDLV